MGVDPGTISPAALITGSKRSFPVEWEKDANQDFSSHGQPVLPWTEQPCTTLCATQQSSLHRLTWGTCGFSWLLFVLGALPLSAH